MMVKYDWMCVKVLSERARCKERSEKLHGFMTYLPCEGCYAGLHKA